ncbi:pyrroline-5-carboxylate reductase [Pollutibacter soli]|uniref:pyrroline-5-carboxylate reductase n=1 Tax=Pollutibacter soli TaxID=3034157 RepID=UPI0030138001
MNKKIAIIGGGNLGKAIAEGLIMSGFTLPQHILITRRNIEQIRYLEQKGVTIGNNNNEAVRYADIVVLAVKPFQIAEVLKQLKPDLDSKRHLLISVITGISIEDIQSVTGNDMPVVRAMPNTAIAIQESMTCICSRRASDEQQEYVMSLFNQLGKVVSIDEKLMNAATVLGACGIAYALRFIRANIQGGIEIGFDASTATLIAAQTVKGAAELLIQTGRHPEEEIDKVTTPKGCTIAGLNEMEHQGFSSSLIKGISASYMKIAKD